MSEEKAVTTTKPDVPAEWHDREEIVALANRLKAMLPGKLSAEEALLLAQYSAAMDANPFRGEIYAYQHRGKIVLVEGYKLLVRWARRQCQFYDNYRRVTNDTDTLKDGDIAIRCYLLRQDAVDDLARLTQAGVAKAYDILTTQAVGVVSKADRTTKDGKPMDPPTGWTWEQVARKRALKNAINLAYGAPSPREIAEETWMVEDTLTIPTDWEDVTPEMSLAEREALTLANASQREREATPLEQTAAQSMADLGFGEPEPKTAGGKRLYTKMILSDTETPATEPQEPESAASAEGIQPESPETVQESGGNGSPWHNRGSLVFRAVNEIAYFSNAPHAINALKKLERAGDIRWEMDDDTALANLNAYATMRADEKAAEAEKPKRPARRRKEEML